MSTEEDTELRDLVAQTLEVNGCLPKIRAELRASIFLALDEDGEVQKQEPLLNKKVKTHLESQDGRIMFCLVREFLEFFDLDFTISVYEPESYLGTGYQYEGRSKIINDLGISQLKENSTLPILLELIKIARLNNDIQNKNIDINLSKIQGNVEEEESVNNSDEVDESISENFNHEEVSNNSKEDILNPITEIPATPPKEVNLNETFDVNSPTSVLNLKESKNNDLKSFVNNNQRSISENNEEKDDTYDGTSSIAEDSEKAETEFSPPILKDSKSHHSKFDTSFDKLKLSPQKTEKFKSKNSLSSLADLPPLQLNKSRNDTVLLPSLYSKEFKEKTSNQNNLKELDKFFDVDDDNYEEDFMSESEINLNTKNNLLDELQSSSSNNSTDTNKNVSVKSGESKTGLFAQKIDKENFTDANQNLEKKTKTENINGVHSGASSVTSDEINLNVDDILNSPTSN